MDINQVAKALSNIGFKIYIEGRTVCGVMITENKKLDIWYSDRENDLSVCLFIGLEVSHPVSTYKPDSLEEIIESIRSNQCLLQYFPLLSKEVSELLPK